MDHRQLRCGVPILHKLDVPLNKYRATTRTGLFIEWKSFSPKPASAVVLRSFHAIKDGIALPGRSVRATGKDTSAESRDRMSAVITNTVKGKKQHKQEVYNSI